jgi:hypothetical protein
MPSVIRIKRSTTPGSAPTSLAAGELAVNIPDRLLFTSDGSTIFRIGAQYLSVANAAATYATSATTSTQLNLRATWTALASTNTALRTLISDRLQVANAAAVYQTRAVERAALANTNASIATQSSRITLVNTNLLATNTAIRALDNQKLSVANAAATYQTRAVERAALANTNSRINLLNTNLTGTNTAIRTLVSDRLQVANAAATYQTRAIERAALANTNASIATQATRITLVNTNLTATNTAIRALDNQKLSVANAVATYATRSNPTTSGLLAHTGRMTISTNLAVSGNTRITGSTIIDGDLTVEGGVTYVSSSTLNVDDSMVKLASNNASDTVDVGFYGRYVSAATTKHAGIFRDASDGVFKVYAELQPEPTTTVNIAGTGYTLATLDAIIDGGTY